jgi:hypothetical protein
MRKSIRLFALVGGFFMAILFLGGCSSSDDVVAPSPQATLESIALTPANPRVGIGSTQQFTATGSYSDGGTQNLSASVTWNSSDILIATISDTGLSEAIDAGVTTITASLGSVSDSTLLTVTTAATGAVSLSSTGQLFSSGAGDDGDLKMGVAWPSPRFTDNGDGTVEDLLTGLMWLKDANCFGLRTWAEAIEDANSLESGDCGLADGSTAGDWRLPNINEIESLVNAGAETPALWLNTQGFSDVQADYYWASTTHPNRADWAFIVYMDNADSGWDFINAQVKDNLYYNVWPVRDGAATAPARLWKTGQTISYATGDDGDLQKGVDWPSPRFTVGTGAEAGCVIDNLTGLMWERNASGSDHADWVGALSYANNLSLGGYDDWRLPNRKELRSLINYGVPITYDWLSSQGFDNINGSYYYWSSTAHADTPDTAWGVNMVAGGTLGQSMDDPTLYVWAVRGGQ